MILFYNKYGESVSLSLVDKEVVLLLNVPQDPQRLGGKGGFPWGIFLQHLQSKSLDEMEHYFESKELWKRELPTIKRILSLFRKMYVIKKYKYVLPSQRNRHPRFSEL